MYENFEIAEFVATMNSGCDLIVHRYGQDSEETHYPIQFQYHMGVLAELSALGWEVKSETQKFGFDGRSLISRRYILQRRIG